MKMTVLLYHNPRTPACEEVEIDRELSEKGARQVSVPTFLNHRGNSECLFLNGKFSFYCPKNVDKVFKEDSAPHLSLKLREYPVKMVALASIVRSGNSWIRYLVETASGIATEASYAREVGVVVLRHYVRKTTN